MPTHRIPSDFSGLSGDCYCLIKFTTVIGLRESCNPSQLLLKYAICHSGSPQKSPQSPQPRTGNHCIRLSLLGAYRSHPRGLVENQRREGRLRGVIPLIAHNLLSLRTLPCLQPLKTNLRKNGSSG
jgi:hypothetical protein